MPAMLRPTKPLLKEPYQSILDEATAAPLATSILGGIVAEPTRRLMQSFAKRMPENVIEKSRHDMGNKLNRIFSTQSGISEQSKRDAIERTMSDRIGNVFIGDDIDIVDDLGPQYGNYTGLMRNINEALPVVLDDFIDVAKQGPDVLRNWIRTWRRGQPAIRMVKGKDYTKIAPHEGTHASQDRMGVLLDPLGSHSQDYIYRPHEWEAKFGEIVGDPAKSRLGIPGVLARGQREMWDNVTGIEPGPATDERLESAVKFLNSRLASMRPLDELLDIRQSIDRLGKVVSVPSFSEVQDPKLSSFMRAILGVK